MDFISQENRIKIIVVLVSLLLVGGVFYFLNSKSAQKGKAVKLSNPNQTEQAYELNNTGPVSPISGIQCEAWNRRPIAVMQPSDPQARPAAGFSEADIVFELPAYANSVTRLMGVYLCNIPKEIGAIRSSRHDYIPLAKSLDAVFVHWGGSHFALDLLAKKVIDHIDCMNSSACERWPITGKMRLEDTGHITADKITAEIKKLGFEREGKLAGYPHQGEAPIDQRPSGGHLRVSFPKPWDVSYDYDKVSNTYFRTWNGDPDTDRNNQQRLAPKNVVVMFAEDAQITNSQDYVGQGLKNPWEGVEADKNTGKDSISGRYNNIQLGDPWYDTGDSGEAHFYFNGQEIIGTWKKDKANISSKLFFYDGAGQEIKFVPGQIWVEVLEPGQGLKWEPVQ